MTGIVHDGMIGEKRRESFWRFRNVRFYVALLLCLNFFSLGLMRNSLGIAMVCMVNSTAIGILEDYDSTDDQIASKTLLNNVSSHCPITSYVRHEYEGEFIWSTETQGMLFAALYWGSFTSLPGGWFADRYSPRHILLGSVILNVLCSVLTPVAAYYGGHVAMFVVRLLMGFGQGLQKPTVMAFAARWFPPGERSTAISLYTAGNQIGNIVGMPLNAWLCHLKSLLHGWPLIFLTSGGIGLIWCFTWYFTVTNRPETHTKISKEEEQYIIKSLTSQSLRGRKEAARSVPWRKVLLSTPVLACSFCSFVNGLVVSTTSSYIPTYFMEVLHLDLYSNGLYSALPYVSQSVSKFSFAAVADYLVKNKRLSPTMSTKIFNSIGCFGTAVFLFCCSFLTCSHTFLAITFLCLSMACFAAYAPGYWTSMVSIAPVYSGTISSFTTTTCQIGSIIAPYLVGAISVHGTRGEWQIIFAILSTSLVLCGIFYIVFGSADIQEWAKQEVSCVEVDTSTLDENLVSSSEQHEEALH